MRKLLYVIADDPLLYVLASAIVWLCSFAIGFIIGSILV